MGPAVREEREHFASADSRHGGTARRDVGCDGITGARDSRLRLLPPLRRVARLRAGGAAADRASRLRLRLLPPLRRWVARLRAGVQPVTVAAA
mmetsp:Transcript_60141/g.196443  ORF Transcript_60141/g.196443 Transcript_60141/m.196443 type:complete len:93 (+) Transcript_60141:1078-1356(+)